MCFTLQVKTLQVYLVDDVDDNSHKHFQLQANNPQTLTFDSSRIKQNMFFYHKVHSCIVIVLIIAKGNQNQTEEKITQ